MDTSRIAFEPLDLVATLDQVRGSLVDQGASREAVVLTLAGVTMKELLDRTDRLMRFQRQGVAGLEQREVASLIARGVATTNAGAVAGALQDDVVDMIRLSRGKAL